VRRRGGAAYVRRRGRSLCKKERRMAGVKRREEQLVTAGAKRRWEPLLRKGEGSSWCEKGGEQLA
jgi:hypothetical protein